MRTEEHLASTVEDVTTAEETDVQRTNLRFVVPEPDEPEAEASGPLEEPARELVFQLKDVEVKYSGHTAIREVDLDIAAKEITAFIGPSGCGKTTVLRCLNRMHDLTPGAQVLGRVEYHGENLYGPKVDPAEVDRQLAAFADSLKAKGQTLAGYARQSGQTEAGLRETWADLVAMQAYVRQHVAPAELQKYFEANREHFDGVEVQAAHVLLRPQGSPVERARCRERLEAIRAEIVSGRLDFAAAARKHSQCPSATRGGDLGPVPRKGGLQDEAFAKAAFALKVGELSPVVETSVGFHLIRVSARTPGTPAAFERCVEDVRDAYADDFRAGLLPRLRREGQVQLSIP